jgi:hypothetical protein
MRYPRRICRTFGSRINIDRSSLVVYLRMKRIQGPISIVLGMHAVQILNF